ncbi:hypothetical protein [Jannaschia rubra]|uniref:Ferrochelatase n=1 Tax=Jannaschia rubra TaxID=282197 RepID=A0A0M6XN59_9RHOB|nr:hypothetical protein [Jannaschia rubra]CTQ32519.1 hypothetical protein JAN5088_01290 [Jannaschia rubra]SFF84042.1 hypothetical protein SAMN04488517_101453 [Jannaschia rubra]
MTKTLALTAALLAAVAPVAATADQPVRLETKSTQDSLLIGSPALAIGGVVLVGGLLVAVLSDDSSSSTTTTTSHND